MFTATQTSYRVLGAISLILSIPSIIGSSYIVYSWHRAQKKKDQQKNDVLSDYVSYMSISDLIFVLLRALFISNATFKWSFIAQFPGWFCGIIGAFYNFSIICTTTWNFVIVTFILIPMIRGTPLYRISKHKKYHFAFSLTIWMLVIILPFVTPNDASYGFADTAADNYGLSKYQCWIVNKLDILCLTSFVMLYLIWSLIVLSYTVYIYRKNKTIQKLTSQLFWYSVAFELVWGIPTLYRIYAAITGDISFIFECVNSICIHCVGWSNALVWYSYVKVGNDNTTTRYQSIDVSSHCELVDDAK